MLSQDQGVDLVRGRWWVMRSRRSQEAECVGSFWALGRVPILSEVASHWGRLEAKGRHDPT